MKNLSVDLISVRPFTPIWNYLYSCLTKYRRFISFTCFNRDHELNEVLDNISICRKFISCFRFRWIPTIKLQTWPRNNLPICPLVPQSCLITFVFCPPRLTAPMIFKPSLLSSFSLPLFLIGETAPQVISVLNSFLPAAVAPLLISMPR